MADKRAKEINKGYHHRYPTRVNGNHGGQTKKTSKKGK